MSEGPPSATPSWVVGLETLLDPANPVASYGRFLRLAKSAFPDAPSVFDPTSLRIFSREELEWMLPPGVDEPVAEALWIVHAVSDDRHNADSVWLHTHGLHRCGRAELEMLEVPRALSSAAAELLNHIAEVSIDDLLAEPGDVVAIGHDLTVALQPWQSCVGFMSAGAPGGIKDRTDGDQAHIGVRAVVCGSKPRGVFRKLWTWPRETLETLATGRAVIFRTEQATRRSAALARATWPDLAMCFADLRRAGRIEQAGRVRFLLKVGIRCGEGPEEGLEHMWFEALGFTGDQAEARLLNQPLSVLHLHEGDVIMVQRANLSDWSVHTPEDRFEPGRGGGLRRAIEAIQSR